MKKYHIWILSALLVVCGVGLFLYKVFELKYPLQPDETESRWVVEAHLSFNAKNKAVKASLKIPKSTEDFLIMDESFISRGYGLVTRTVGDDREAVWTKRQEVGWQGLYYRAVVGDGGIDSRLDVPKNNSQIAEGAKKEAMRSIIDEAKQKSADTESLVQEVIKQLQIRTSDVKLVCGPKTDNESKSNCAVSLLQNEGYKARVVHGVFLKPERNVPIEHRVQVLDKKNWLSFDPNSGARIVQDNFLPWWYGETEIASVENASQVRVRISVERFQADALSAATEYAKKTAPNFVEFSLFKLPIETQRVYRVLLLVPIGAFVVVLLRNIVGFVTFGTFMPVLIALAFRETEMAWGVALFSILIGLGVAARSYLERLKLLLVPRLSAMLIIVVLIMAIFSIITHKLGIERGISVALFPMVIITMTIERMSIVWDESGAGAALKQGIGTLIVSCLIYLIIKNPIVEHIVFVFPEVLLVVLALTILVGRYSGYRLMELRRFRALAKDTSKNDEAL